MIKISIYDEFSPEDIAMTQALYSRSQDSVTDHIEKVKKSGSGKFMEKFYVGYGHKSIADCGSTTIFIENVSILVAKAIQDWPLYSGQESSTRYIDYSKKEIIDPINSSMSSQIQKNWINFYLSNKQKVVDHLKTIYPKRPDEKASIYENAIMARSFDILRGFLPAGITTQLSWHTNLRQAWDKLSILQYHPLDEVVATATEILNLLRIKYPNSFKHEISKEQQEYYKYINKYYFPSSNNRERCTSNIDPDIITNKLISIIKNRPPKTNLPNFLNQYGSITFEYKLDFGSFRDIQRHRNGVCRLPLLTYYLGFNQWYLDQLPDEVRYEAIALILDQKNKISDLDASLVNLEILQYYIPMGFNVMTNITYGLPEVAYVIELRSGKTVHPTLRKFVHRMYSDVISMFPNLKLYVDLDKDDWDIRRGLQTIKEIE